MLTVLLQFALSWFSVLRVVPGDQLQKLSNKIVSLAAYMKTYKKVNMVPA